MLRKKPTLLIALAAVSLFVAACGRSPDAPARPAPKSWNLPLIQAPTGVPVEYTSTGTVVSDQRIDVASRLSGYIRDILVHEGDRVRRGQVLARLDASDVDGSIRQGQARVSATEAVFRDAQTDLERFERLFESGSVSENEFRKIRLKSDASREALNQARAAHETAIAQRDYADIKSPIDGVVVARAKRAGDLAVPGAPILTLESGQGLLFETFVAEGQVAAIAPGNPVEVRIDGLSDPLRGTVSRVVRSGDPVTRSYQVKISLPHSAGLMPGMFGRASFSIGESALPVVPRQAVVERGGLKGVFVVDGEGRAYFRWLRIGREWSDRVEITAGLQAGDRLVASAEPALRDGDRITGRETRNE